MWEDEVVIKYMNVSWVYIFGINKVPSMFHIGLWITCSFEANSLPLSCISLTRWTQLHKTAKILISYFSFLSPISNLYLTLLVSNQPSKGDFSPIYSQPPNPENVKIYIWRYKVETSIYNNPTNEKNQKIITRLII